MTIVTEIEEPTLGSYFISTYPPFSCWNAAGAESFRRLLQRPAPSAHETPLGLYVHVPFCQERCQYCYYLSYDDRPGEIDRYLEAVVLETELYARTPALSGRRAGFVYFGGGTPSLLSAPRIRRLLDGLRSAFPWDGAREVTFECAPRSVSGEKLEILRRAGVTRISIGVQELDDEVLELNGRVHRVRDIERAWTAIRRVGFPVVNVDLIAGLVGQTDSSFAASLERVVELAPESITIYLLEIPGNTPLYRAARDGTLTAPLPSWEAKRSRLRQGFAHLERAGYVVRSGYAAVRDPARHAFVYQDEQYRGADLLGVGVSSFSYLAGINQQNLAALGDYLERLGAGELALWRGYELDDEERMVRELILQLKLGGVDRDDFRRRYGVEVATRFARTLARLADLGYLSVDADAVRLTREGLLRVDRLLPVFYLPKHRGVPYS